MQRHHHFENIMFFITTFIVIVIGKKNECFLLARTTRCAIHQRLTRSFGCFHMLHLQQQNLHNSIVHFTAALHVRYLDKTTVEVGMVTFIFNIVQIYIRMLDNYESISQRQVPGFAS
jgi:hypothetical protein